jgi:signal transduction histidine kinase
VDENKMMTILTNLMENAVKYNRERGTVTVTLDADNKQFTISVKDTGIGIPGNAQDKIFERFYRVDTSRSREVGGTGLGLSIVRSAVLLHRGSIRVESGEGLGTEMVVSIPLTYAVQSGENHA